MAQARNTKRLTIEINESLSLEIEAFIKKQQEGGYRYSLRSFFETAGREFLDEKASLHRETYFEMARVLRDEQKEIQDLLRHLSEAQLIFIQQFFGVFGGVENNGSGQEAAFHAFYDQLRRNVEAGSPHVESLRQLANPTKHASEPPAVSEDAQL